MVKRKGRKAPGIIHNSGIDSARNPPPCAAPRSPFPSAPFRRPSLHIAPSQTPACGGVLVDDDRIVVKSSEGMRRR